MTRSYDSWRPPRWRPWTCVARRWSLGIGSGTFRRIAMRTRQPAHGFMYLVALLELASRARLAALQHADGGVLRRARRSAREVRPSRDLQHFNTDQGAVHERGVARATEGGRRRNQHGRQGALDRQRVHRAAVEERQGRGGLLESL